MEQPTDLEAKILELSEVYQAALADHEENGTEETWQKMWDTSVALNAAVVERRGDSPAQIITEVN